MMNYLVIGHLPERSVSRATGVGHHRRSIAIVTVLNIIGIVSVARANFLIIAIQAIFIVAFVALAIAKTFGYGTVDFGAVGRRRHGGRYCPRSSPAPPSCACPSCRFDAVSTLSEEAKNPERDAPGADPDRHPALRCSIAILLSYVSQLVFPSNKFSDVDSGSLDVMTAAGGQFLSTFFTAAYVAGALGSALTSQASVARILYAHGP